jgi:hypothetical protein
MKMFCLIVFCSFSLETNICHRWCLDITIHCLGVYLYRYSWNLRVMKSEIYLWKTTKNDSIRNLVTGQQLMQGTSDLLVNVMTHFYYIWNEIDQDVHVQHSTCESTLYMFTSLHICGVNTHWYNTNGWTQKKPHMPPRNPTPGRRNKGIVFRRIGMQWLFSIVVFCCSFWSHIFIILWNYFEKGWGGRKGKYG